MNLSRFTKAVQFVPLCALLSALPLMQLACGPEPSTLNPNNLTPINRLVLSGSYTANNVSLLFENNVGKSLIAERSRLLEWAVDIGLVGIADKETASKVHPQARVVLASAPALLGVQTLLLGESRFVAPLDAEEGTGQLYAKLQSLTYNARANEIRADVVFQITGGDKPDSRQKGPEALLPDEAYMSLKWRDVSFDGETLTIAWTGHTYIDEEGVEHTIEDGAASFAPVGDIVTAGTWAFRTLLSVGEDKTWASDARLAGFSYNWDALKMYDRTTFWFLSASPFAPRDYLTHYCPEAQTIPVGGTVQIDDSEDYYNDFTLNAMSLSGSNGNIVASAQAVYRQSGAGADYAQSQRTTFEFSQGVELIKDVSLAGIVEQCGCPGVAERFNFPDVGQYSIVFCRLTQHEQVYLDTGTVVSDQSDDDASIEIVGDWVNPRINVAIQNSGSDTVNPGDRVTLTASPSGFNYAWFLGRDYVNPDLCDLVSGEIATGQDFSFNVPANAVAGSGISVFVIVYNNDASWDVGWSVHRLRVAE